MPKVRYDARGISERLKEIRRDLGLTQKQMAMALKVTLRSYQKYEYGDALPSESVLELLSLKFDVNPDWVLTGEGEKFRKEPEGWPPPGALKVGQIPVYGHVPAGWPEKIEAREKPLSYIYVPKDWISPGTIALIVQGDSMAPTLKNGEIVLVEPVSSPPKDGTIVVASWNGEYTIKEIRRTNDKILLIPHNPRFRTIEVSLDSGLRIVGRVTYIFYLRPVPTHD